MLRIADDTINCNQAQLQVHPRLSDATKAVKCIHDLREVDVPDRAHVTGHPRTTHVASGLVLWFYTCMYRYTVTR